MNEIKAQGLLDGINTNKQLLLHAKLLCDGVLFPVLDNLAKDNSWLTNLIPFVKDVLKKVIEAELAKYP